MGINSQFIVKNVNVDNITLETNGDGQIQIKGGAVATEMIRNGAVNMDKLAYSFTLGTSFLEGESANSTTTSTAFVSVHSFEFKRDLSSGRIGCQIGNTAATSYVQIYKNGVLVKSDSKNDYGWKTVTYDDDFVEGDVIEYKLRCDSATFGAGCCNKGIYGTAVQEGGNIYIE